MTVGLVRVEVGTWDAEIYAPLWARGTIKSMPVRAWNGKRRCWTIPARHVGEMVWRLERAGFTVRVINEAAGIRPPLRLPAGPTGRDERRTTP